MAITTVPAVPSSGTPATNQTGDYVSVTIAANGATITNVSVNGTTVGTAAGSYGVPPGGTISIAYTGGPPTWTWANQLTLGYTPGVSAMNTQAEAPGWSPYAALPYATHAAAGVSALGVAVSN